MVAIILSSVVSYGTISLFLKRKSNTFNYLINSRSVAMIHHGSISLSSNFLNISIASFRFTFYCLGSRYINVRGALFLMLEGGLLHSPSSLPIFLPLLVTPNSGVVYAKLTCFSSNFSLSFGKSNKAWPNWPHALQVYSLNLDKRGHLLDKFPGSFQMKKMVLLNSILLPLPLLLPYPPNPPLYIYLYLKFVGDILGEDMAR